MADVCSWRYVWTFDNFLRPWIHPPEKVFGPYLEPGMRVLDVGCGAGFSTLAMARLIGDAGRVLAADVQPEMLAMIREKSARAGLADRVATHRCPADGWDLSGPFDFINAFWMVHETPDPKAFFRHLAQCLAPEGRLLVVEPKGHVSRSAFDRMLGDAATAGLSEFGRPRIRFSRAVVFGRLIGLEFH